MDRISISEVSDSGSIPDRGTTHLIKQVPEYKFDYKKIRTDVMAILEQNQFPNQIGLTHSIKAVTEQERLFESIGSIYDRVNGVFRYKETDFCIFNEAYKNTYLHEVYNTIPNLGRFRIMSLTGPSCYTIHRDQTRRYHFVIETNPDCLFLFTEHNEMVHIPLDGNVYLLDTRYKHTFLNGSRQRRIHLVMDDLSTLL